MEHHEAHIQGHEPWARPWGPKIGYGPPRNDHQVQPEFRSSRQRESRQKRPSGVGISVAEQRRIVEESFQPETSVARVALTHEVNANQVFSWPQPYQHGRLAGGVCAA